MAADLTEEELDLLLETFDLARAGRTGELVGRLRAGVPANLTNSGGDTLLILAAYHEHPGTVAALLAEGADTARVNDRGQTALAAAVFRRNRTSVAALLEAGADPDLGPRSAVAVAGFFGLDEMLDLLGRPGPGGVDGAQVTDHD